VLLFGCTNQKENTLSERLEISFDQKNNALVVSNIDDYIINSIQEDLKTDSSLNNSLAVFIKTEDEDLQDLEKPLAGKYQLEKNSILFLPIFPFVKGESYLVEIYLQNPSGDVSNLLKSGNSILQNQTIQKEIVF
jgi:hypothetical protein